MSITKKRLLYIFYFLFTSFLAISLFVTFLEFNKLSNKILINLTFAIILVWALTGFICLQFWYQLNYVGWKAFVAFLLALALIWIVVIAFDWIQWEMLHRDQNKNLQFHQKDSIYEKTH